MTDDLAINRGGKPPSPPSSGGTPATVLVRLLVDEAETHPAEWCSAVIPSSAHQHTVAYTHAGKRLIEVSSEWLDWEGDNSSHVGGGRHRLWVRWLSRDEQAWLLRLAYRSLRMGDHPTPTWEETKLMEERHSDEEILLLMEAHD